ncbi:MAG: Ig-like domain-containing protein, partial [Eubacterium sp.]|nr:Ig-like domain-containing protein [Eubacterium sp.]
MKRSIMIGGVIAMGLAMSFNFTAEAKTARTKTVKAEKTVKTKTVKAEKKEDKKENKKSKTTKKMVFQDEEGKTIKSATMYRSEKHTFELKHVDEETLKEITWRSSDRQIAKVSKKGVVTAKKLGKCYIIATNPETKKYT